MDHRTALSISYSKWYQRGGYGACTQSLSSLILIKAYIFQRKSIFNCITWVSYSDKDSDISRTNEYTRTSFSSVTQTYYMLTVIEVKVRTELFDNIKWNVGPIAGLY